MCFRIWQPANSPLGKGQHTPCNINTKRRWFDWHYLVAPAEGWPSGWGGGLLNRWRRKLLPGVRIPSPPPFYVSLKNQIFELAFQRGSQFPPVNIWVTGKSNCLYLIFWAAKNSKTDEQHEMESIFWKTKKFTIYKISYFSLLLSNCALIC